MLSRILYAAVLLLPLTALLACQDDGAKIERLRDEAHSAAASGDADESLRKLREALSLRPRDASTNLELAKALEANGRLADAAFYFAEARRLDPTSVEASVGEVRAILADEPDRAWRLIGALIERFPDEPSIRVTGSQVAMVRGDLGAARYHALTATELDSEFGDAFLMLSRVQILRSNHHGEKALRESLAAAQRADQLEPSPQAKALVARALAAIGEDPDAAKDAFLSAIRETGQHAASLEALDEVTDHALAWAEGDLEFTRAVLETRLEVGPAKLPRWRALAKVTSDTGGSTDEVWKQLLDARGNESVIRLAFFAALEERGEIQRLGEELAQAVKEFPTEPSFLRAQLRFALRHDGDTQGVLTALREKFPDHPERLRAEALLALHRGEAEDAARHLRSAVDRQPTPGSLAELAEAELAAGDAAAAIVAADRGLGEPGERLDLLLALHRARSRGAAELGDWPEVVAQLEVVRERSELDSDELLLLARARYATGGAADGKRMLDELLASPEWPPASALLFAEQHGTAELKRARRLLDEALERSPADPQLIASAVRLDLADGERARAKARLGGAIDHRKGGAEVLLLLRAKLGVEDGDVAAAANDARKAFNADPRLPDAVVALVATHRAVDDEQVAFQLLDQAERAQRLDAAGLADACRAWIQRGVFDRALALCTGALKLKNDLPRAQGDLAYLLARRGGRHLEEALGLAQDAIDALGADPDSSATLGFLYWRKRLYSPSVTYLERALELSADAKPPAGFDLGPTHSEASIHFFLGRALEGAGRDSLASQALERALTLDPAVEERVGLPGLHSQAN